MSAPLKDADDLENTFVEDRVNELLPKFEALTPFSPRKRERGVTSEGLEGWRSLASKEAMILKDYYPDPETKEHLKTYSTVIRQITALKKALKQSAKTDLKDPQTINQVNTIIKNFGNALSFLFSTYKQRTNENYRQRVQVRKQKENRIELDLSSYLEYAYEVLSNLENLKSTDWQDVSCALALATGRRMAEIHLSASFKQIDEYKLEFKGYLKGKARKIAVEGGKNVMARYYPFEIPSLVPAELCCAGLDWLDKKDKRFPPSEDSERVNRRFSKPLNQHVKNPHWCILDEGMTYHKFRGAYFRACVVNADIDPLDYMDFARQTLGDRDETTIRAYQRFEIKQGSLTRM